MHKLSELTTKIDDIQENSAQFSQRLRVMENIDRQGSRNRDASHESASGFEFPSGSARPREEGQGQHSVRVPRTEINNNINHMDSDAQQEFVIIKDSLSKVRLPKELKVEDSRQGVRRGEQGRIVTIGKCARYAETSLKLLSTINEDHVTAGDLNDLIVINVAMLRYLQEEHSLVHVNGSFGDGVERIYRNFRRNTSVFPPDAIEALQAAVSMDAATFRGRGRGTSGPFRGRGRGRGNSIYNVNQRIYRPNQHDQASPFNPDV